MAWLYAQWVFFLHLILHFLKKPFQREHRGADAFLRRYRSEGLIPLSTVDKNWLNRFSQCFNCGYCDSACPPLYQWPREVFPGPSFLVTTYARATPDFSWVNLDFSFCEGCRHCEAACPNGVPVKEALEFIEAKSALERQA